MTTFYRDVLGLSPLRIADDDAGFVSLDAGAIALCLHAIPSRAAKDITVSSPPKWRDSTPIKLCFRTDDVASLRDELSARRANMGPAKQFGDLCLCDGVDPEGNVFQLSNRP